MPYQVNKEYAKEFLDFALSHPEMENVTFASENKVEKYIAIFGVDENVNDYMSNIESSDIMIDPSYNNIYEDFINCSYISDKAKEYFTYFVNKNDKDDIIDLINKSFINQLLTMKNIDAKNVYIRIHDTTNSYLFNELLRV